MLCCKSKLPIVKKNSPFLLGSMSKPISTIGLVRNSPVVEF